MDKDKTTGKQLDIQIYYRQIYKCIIDRYTNVLQIDIQMYIIDRYIQIVMKTNYKQLDMKKGFYIHCSNSGLLAKKSITLEIPPDSIYLYPTKELYVFY